MYYNYETNAKWNECKGSGQENQMHVSNNNEELKRELANNKGFCYHEKTAVQAIMEALCSTNLLLHLRKTAYVQPESLTSQEPRIWLPLSTLSPPSSRPTCLQVGTQAPEVSVGQNLI